MSLYTFTYLYMDEIVQFALTTLREKSPVGSTGDRHPGLYRDSHIIFIAGHVVQDASGWQPGQQINISTPVPYARKIETGRMKMSVPGAVYEQAQQIVSARYGNQINCKLTYMPVRFGDVQAYANFSKQIRSGSKKGRQDWLVRQPALEITAR